jgi:protein SCO1
VGSYEDTKKMCKAWRVYFSTPPNTKEGDDYLVDHSIFVYLMDPEGKFVEAFGQVTTVEDIVERTEKEFKMWEEEKGTKA